MKHIKGPDFPTGGQMLNSKVELREIYEAGQGAIRVRGEYKLETRKRGGERHRHHLDPVRGHQGDAGRADRRGHHQAEAAALLDVRDESTDDVRIVLELKKDADPAW